MITETSCWCGETDNGEGVDRGTGFYEGEKDAALDALVAVHMEQVDKVTDV